MLFPVVENHRLDALRGKPVGSLMVHEIYRSLQGESTFAGLPCVFVRLTACSARCVWCDTPHAFRGGKVLSLDAVVGEVIGYGCPLVELTGGEPLLQEESHELMTRLADSGETVLLETSGTVPVERVDRRVHIIMDLKCPGSGECENNLWSNLGWLKPTDQIKFVIASREDFDWTVAAIREHGLDRRFTVLLSSVFGPVNPAVLAEWLLDSGLNVRLQLQLHKYIWEPNARGV
ncbi:7-carboxy-7-deazaguanine synthase QueE [Tautonia plasticadhaerens]|uniref:7-carboxy-7-deazaguanine synthase n=1 Tax=Tautonia plasticadhaerens TaxID=2527974 RepID=A0A518H998_9BACT|nr:7-carboxy-7-deazaguanine synthase QueE [Tautonia plasticadhaerens]QDV37422.1 7-carboxy-7-deazaguanine synthase [Tautonia plasticadhaerens]